jgi:hypothetical protein
MSPAHVEALEGFGGTLCTARHDCPLPHDEANEIQAVVRSLASGEKVMVSREELEAIRRGMMFKQMSAEYINARKLLDSTLATTEVVS